MVFVFFVLRHFAILVLLAAAAWTAGRLLLTPLRRRAGATPWGLTLAIGLAALGHVCYLASLAGWLTRTTAGVIAAALLVTCAVRIARGPDRPRTAPDGSGGIGAVSFSLGLPSSANALFNAIWWLVLAWIVAAAFALALFPPLGFDETMYHLPFTRAIASSGGLGFWPSLRFPVFPQLAESLNAAVLLLARDDVATQLTGWLAMIAAAGLTAAWTRELCVGHVDRSPANAASFVAIACLAGSPMAFLLATAGYVEPLLALFGTGALYAAWRAAASRERSVAHAERGTSEPGDVAAGRAWLLTSAALAGSAASVKYLGLFFVPAAIVMLLPPPRSLSRGEPHATRASSWFSRPVLRDLLLFSMVAVALLAPTYAHIAALTGNPVFPFYPRLFGPNDWAWPEDVLRPDRGFARVARLVTMLWDLTFRRHQLGGLPPISPVFAFGAPLVIAMAWRHAALRRPLLLAIAWLALATTHGHHMFGSAPLWSVLIGVSVAALATDVVRWRRAAATPSASPSPAWITACAILLALGGAAYGAYRLSLLGPPPATPRARAQLLAAQRPLYPAFALLARTAGAAPVYAIGAPEMAYFLNGPLLGDFVGPASWDRVAARADALGSVADAMKEIGVTYLLVPSQPTRGIEGMRPLIEAWKARAAADRELRTIYADEHATIYRVDPAAPALALAGVTPFSH